MPRRSIPPSLRIRQGNAPLELIKRLPDSQRKTILRLGYIQGAMQRAQEPENRATVIDRIIGALPPPTTVDERIIACGLNLSSAFACLRRYSLVDELATASCASTVLTSAPNGGADPASR